MILVMKLLAAEVLASAGSLRGMPDPGAALTGRTCLGDEVPGVRNSVYEFWKVPVRDIRS
jgi:hypothetical protein